MLTNNTKALVMAEIISKEDALSCLQGIHDYGISPVPVLDMLKNNSNCKTIVGALNNADTDGMLQILAKTNPAGIAAGLKILAKATGAEEALLILRNGDNEEALVASGKTAGIKLAVEVSEQVKAQAYKKELIFNIETLAAIADKVSGTEPGILLRVNDDVPKEITFGTKLADILGDIDDIKAIKINHCFYGVDILDTVIIKEKSYGSGVINTICKGECILHETQKELEVLRKESCGKCTFCREGLYQLNIIFEDITKGQAKKEDMAMIEELTKAMEFSGNCTLGKVAGLPAASAITEFLAEVEEHVKKKNCPAGKCLAFTNIYVDPKKCQGCGKCIEVCPVDCIEGKKGYISMIDEFDCNKCGKCIEVCPEHAIIKTSGKVPKLLSKLTKVKGSKTELEDSIEEKKDTRRKRHRTTLVMPIKN